MDIRAFIHLEYENPVIKVGEDCKDDLMTIPVHLGDEVVVFVTGEQLEDLLNKSCKRLYRKSYSDLQDKIFNLTDDLKEANDKIETLREQAVNE